MIFIAFWKLFLFAFALVFGIVACFGLGWLFKQFVHMLLEKNTKHRFDHGKDIHWGKTPIQANREKKDT